MDLHDFVIGGVGYRLSPAETRQRLRHLNEEAARLLPLPSCRKCSEPARYYTYVWRATDIGPFDADPSRATSVRVTCRNGHTRSLTRKAHPELFIGREGK